MVLFTKDSYRISHSLNILRQILIITIFWHTEISSGLLSRVKIMRSIDGQVDRIFFPRELCEVTSAEDVGCGVRMQVQKARSSCSCICNQTHPAAGTSYVKTTLGYYNGSWKCWNNANLRHYTGCNLSSTGEAITDPILDISTGESYVFKIPNQRCRVNAANSTYLTCNGTLSLLHESILRRYVNTSTKFTRNQIVIEHTGVLESHPSFSGRVIRLAVQCIKSRKTRNVGCIVIKAKGNLGCPIIIPTKKSSEDSIAKTVTIATTKKILTPEKILKSSEGSKAKTVTIAITKKILTPGSPRKDRKQLHGPKTEAITSNVIKKQKQIDKTFVKSMAVTIGAFLSVVLTVMIVLFLVVMVMKSNKTRYEDHIEPNAS